MNNTTFEAARTRAFQDLLNSEVEMLKVQTEYQNKFKALFERMAELVATETAALRQLWRYWKHWTDHPDQKSRDELIKDIIDYEFSVEGTGYMVPPTKIPIHRSMNIKVQVCWTEGYAFRALIGGGIIIKSKNGIWNRTDAARMKQALADNGIYAKRIRFTHV